MQIYAGNDHTLGFVTGGSAHVQMQFSTKECESLGLTDLALCLDCNTFAEYVKDQDSCQNVVSLSWLDYVRDLDAMSQYSWGSATLACLYSRLCHASRASAITSGGLYLLLQLWAWERIPVIRSDVLPYSGIGDFPRGGRWAAERTGVDPYSRCSTHYREQLALLRMDQFI
ncbi:serine/threonine-protein phosphatase 7 long form homolog isoform X4 [Coffea arabica]|uniref:Serine/threonine-protein phosphatase 7 long form homolog isoform X4 n=1 Tax=Coffea arabica TaxID=13443 RepID=A0ABM4V3N1_COFAR